MSELTFSIWKPFIKSEKRGERWLQPILKTFDKLTPCDLKHEKGLYHLEVDKNTHYVFIVIESGKLEPRDTTVTDYYTNQKRENPKSETELEFLKQFFVLFDLDNNLLYFSDVRHRNLLEKILKDTTEVEFSIKGFYEDKEEFLKILSSVDEIQFTSKDDIFSTLSQKREALYDLFETDGLKDITLNVKLSSMKINNIKAFLRKIVKESENHQLSGILIRGNDDAGFEHVFNRGTFIKKISINVEKQQATGKFLGSEVKDILLKEIESLANEKVTKKR
ncbi:hypothetical protein MK407_10955 [Streptococcus sanguinis]|uniref:Uncharacterized protein n=1 Tax=Streptococcus sanguinis SK72 TaxID=888809 RepID=F0I3H9_STRSA|nr:hypothetical protein [Streptococcus sanguinis]EGD28978.1 hypothetical protein HMPREF9381_1719 [Streptococcus sanguinis SK72]MCY7039727.1 hypothetical protein [Streptococcus sanguinis]